MDIFLNGKMVSPENATLSALDSGLQHSVGLFETLNVHSGSPFALKEHLERLANSSQKLGLVRELNIEGLAQAVNLTISHNKIQHARLRLTITAGSVSMVSGDKPGEPQPTILIVPTPMTDYDPNYFLQGVDVLFGQPLANPFDPMSGHKTLNYWPRLRTLRQAAAAGASEAIILNISNHIASGCISNIFVVKNEILFTPFAHGHEVEGALPAPVLPGVTRGHILQIAENMGVKSQQKMLTAEDVLEADEIFLTNSSWYVLPVKKVEQKEIGEGQAGKITLLLRDGLLDMIEAETTRHKAIIAEDENPTKENTDT